MDSIRLSTIQAPAMDYIVQAVGDYLSAQLNIPVQFINDVPWPERERHFDQQAIDICWMCGLPYVWKTDDPQTGVELLAAPVMRAARYQNQPVYFSDVVVRADSTFQTFDDLRGTRWAYNEPRSQSGYNITRYHLARRATSGDYFGQVIEAGSHQAALEMLLAGEIDAAAIDSTVLDEVQRAGRLPLRVVETLGPSPMPPWVVNQSVPPARRAALRRVLLSMHHTPDGQRILNQTLMARFAAMHDADYDSIRHMYQVAEGVIL